MDGLQALALDEILESLSSEQRSHNFPEGALLFFHLKIQHIKWNIYGAIKHLLFTRTIRTYFTFFSDR